MRHDGERPLVALDRLGEFLPVDAQISQELRKRRLGRIKLDGSLQTDERVVKPTLAPEQEAKVGVCFCQTRLESDGLNVRCRSAIEFTQLAEDVSQIVVQGRHAWKPLDGLFTMRQGLLSLTLLEQHLAQVGAGECVAGVELDCAAEVVERFICLAGLAKHVAQIVMRGCKPRPLADRAAKCLGGLFPAARGLKRQPHVRQSLGVLRLEADRCLAASDCALIVTHRAIRLGEIGVKCRIIRPVSDRAADQFDRPRVIPLLMTEHA
jgi:hypothetical protein